MRRLLAGLVGAVLLAGCTTGDDAVDVTNGGEFRFVEATPSGEVIPEGERASAPEFSGTLLETGDPWRSALLVGQVGVLNFWGSWCAPCRVETPDFQAVYSDVRDVGVQFLGVDVKDDRQLAGAFMDRVGAEYPSMYDPRGEVAQAFRGFPANVVPSTILLDTEGRVAAVYTGAVAREDLESALASLLAEAEQ